MRGKLILVVGLATGYVLGSRAGRPRYEQIKAGADKVWNLAPVQKAAQAVSGFAGERVDVLQVKATDTLKKAVSSVLHLDSSSTSSKPKSGSKPTSAPAPKAKPAGSTTTMTPATPAPATLSTDTDE
jgi:hypothetical protein